MIVVRDVFQLQFGKAKEAVALLQGFSKEAAKHGFPPNRILTDRVGQFYTLVMELEFDSLATYDKMEKEILSKPVFSQWYSKFTPLVVEGRREIYNLVDQG